METITITNDLANKILGYLGSRPYVEVAELIADLIKSAQPKTEE